MLGISAAVKAVFDSLASFFSYAETSKEHQAESSVIKDKKKLEKASDVSEDIILLAFKYRKCMTSSDQRKLLRLTKKFKKNN